MLSTVRNNAVRRNFGLGQAPCISPLITTVTSPTAAGLLANSRSQQWHARRAYRSTNALEAGKPSAGQMMREAMGILQSVGVADPTTPAKPKTTRTRKAKTAEEDVVNQEESANPKPKRRKKAADSAQDGEEAKVENEEPKKRRVGRPRKHIPEPDDTENLEVAAKQTKREAAPVAPKKRPSLKPAKITRSDEQSMLRPCVDPMQERLYDTELWNWLDYGRTSKKGSVPPQYRKFDRTRVHVTSEKMVDDILDFIKPTLTRHEGCDIIDLNPGAGVWSTKLNDLLKPRTHLLLEPDAGFYEPMLEPLLGREGTKLVAKDGLVWAELLSVLTPEYLPHQKEHQYSADDVPERNDTLLVTANLGSYPKRKYSSFASATAMILYQFNHAIRSGALFQKYGLVRMLLWLDDEDKAAILPRMAQRRRRVAVDAELNCESITHVAGPDYSDIDPSKRLWFSRDINIDRSSALTALQRMREAGIQTPAGRETKLLREVSQNVDGVVAAGETPIMYDFRHQAEYEELLKDFENGKIALASEDYKAMIRMRIQIDSANKRFSNVHSNMVNFHRLVDEWRLAKAANDNEQIESIMERYKEWEKSFVALGSTACGDWFVQRDNLHLWKQKSMHWDRRAIEPLVIQSDEFFPHVPLSLLDIQPKAAHRVLRSMGPNSDRSGDMAEMLMRSIMTYTNSSMSKVLDHLAPGASEFVYPKCQSLVDPDQGGVPFPGAAEITVRGMSAWQFEDVLEQWMKWPFRPPLEDLISQLSEEYTELDGEEGKFGGVSPEF